MAPGCRRAIAGVLRHGVDDQVAAVELGVELPEARLVRLEAGVAVGVRGFQHQVAVQHVQRPGGGPHGAGQQAVASAGRAPHIGHAHVAAVGIVGQAPGACGHRAQAHAAVVFMAQRDVAVVPEAGNVGLAVAPALAEQARQLESLAQVELHAQVGLHQRDMHFARLELGAGHQFVGPEALLVLLREALAVGAVVRHPRELHLGEAVEAEGADVERLAGGG